MKTLNFDDAPLSLREEAWRLYTESFPEYERRSRQAHNAAINDSEFRSKIVLGDNDEFLGILFYWLHDNMLFVEHIAVNPALRGQSIGSRMLNDLISKYPGRTVLLEIDPPIDEISRRRKVFYERLGFIANKYEYIHPSYTKGDKARPHPLVIMSYGHMISEKEFEDMKKYLYETLLKYTD